MSERFKNRVAAGQRLAEALESYAGCSDLVVRALPRGGVPVGYEVAAALGAPLDVFLVRKLGVPGHEELAMGAIAEGGYRVLNQRVLNQLAHAQAAVEQATAREQAELERRARDYRGERPPPPLEGRTVILVDDGLATGASMRVAVQAVRTQHPTWLVVAVPVAPVETCRNLETEVDELVCLMTPAQFGGVGAWYENFLQTSDEEVRRLLESAREPGASQT